MPNTLLGVTRDQLRRFLPDHQTIRAFEQLLQNVASDLPDTIEQANNNANTALALAAAAMSALTEAVESLDAVLSQPVAEPIADQEDYAPAQCEDESVDETWPARVGPDELEDYAPVAQLGTIASQNADEVEITGGSIDGAAIGATTRAAGSFTTLSATGQITSTVSTGTAPLVIASTTKVTNLNADLLDGTDWSAPGTIGGTTPGSATFTTLATTGNVTVRGNVIQVGTVSASPGSGGNLRHNDDTAVTRWLTGLLGSVGAVNYVIFDVVAGTARLTIDAATGRVTINNGLTVPGGAQFITTSSALTNGAGAAAGTITNAPAAGNPTKWIGVNDAGTMRYIPAW